MHCRFDSIRAVVQFNQSPDLGIPFFFLHAPLVFAHGFQGSRQAFGNQMVHGHEPGGISVLKLNQLDGLEVQSGLGNDGPIFPWPYGSRKTVIFNFDRYCPQTCLSYANAIQIRNDKKAIAIDRIDVPVAVCDLQWIHDGIGSDRYVDFTIPYCQRQHASGAVKVEPEHGQIRELLKITCHFVYHDFDTPRCCVRFQQFLIPGNGVCHSGRKRSHTLFREVFARVGREQVLQEACSNIFPAAADLVLTQGLHTKYIF